MRSSLIRSHTLAAVALLAGAASYASHELDPRGKFKKVVQHGTGKQYQNPKGTKPNRGLRRMKGR
jgi:hypothetical protein